VEAGEIAELEPEVDVTELEVEELVLVMKEVELELLGLDMLDVAVELVVLELDVLDVTVLELTPVVEEEADELVRAKDALAGFLRLKHAFGYEKLTR
jgi:hypothetical protein